MTMDGEKESGMSWLARVLRMLGAGSAGESGGGMESMISCEEALAVVFEFLDGELEPASRGRVKAHFDVCQRCYPQLKLEEAFLATVARARADEHAPSGLRDAVMRLLAEADPA